jgi:hypothetical protein
VNAKTILGLLSLAALASCGGIRQRQFEIHAIDDQLQPLPCLIVVDEKWPASEDAAVYTKSVVNVVFGDRDAVAVTVKAAEVDAAGKPLQMPTQGSVSRYPAETRVLRFTDPYKHLFILPLKQR